MIDQHTIFEIHRMKNENISERKISEKLHLSRKTINKYLNNPNPGKKNVKRNSKLDPFKEQIGEYLEKESNVSSAVIFQHLVKSGFNGKMTIVKDYLTQIRPINKKRRAYIRFESSPGDQCQIDWGHFGSISYGQTKRKLYCLAVIECHSRMLYLEFTHSQKQECLHSGLLNAFSFFKGVPRELVFDNMLTAVIERQGPLIRYNDKLLEFARLLKTVPRACNVRRPNEKGKVEKGGIHYIRYNFWPLREFTNLKDLQRQADEWRDNVANCRVHSTTGEKPEDRLKPEFMNPLLIPLPDCRETAMAKVHRDFSIRFDGNWYTAPPWAVGRQVVVKADLHTVTIYYKNKTLAQHKRSWQKRKRVELPQHCEAANEALKKYWKNKEVSLFMSLGEEAKKYMEHLTETSEPLGKSIRRLLKLKDEYGSYSLIEAIKRASSHNAYGADYIENIMYQEMTPERKHLPVKLKQDNLNNIRIEVPSLKEYDSFILEKNKYDRNR